MGVHRPAAPVPSRTKTNISSTCNGHICKIVEQKHLQLPQLHQRLLVQRQYLHYTEDRHLRHRLPPIGHNNVIYSVRQ